MRQLDARGLICPLPVLKARKVLMEMQSGEMLEVLVTDANTLKDFPLFCTESGHILITAKTQDGVHYITVRRS